MPSKYILREFAPQGYYHIFNRGNGKDQVFFDDEDYGYFLSLFADYLSPPTEKRRRKSLFGEIHLLSYCLMPNHFHLCLQQEKERSITSFVQCVSQVYARYFNKKYDRVGHIFQDKYKARFLHTDADLLNITRYIHANPIELPEVDIETYQFSSFQYFLKGKSPLWLETEKITEIFLSLFNPHDFVDTYRSFVVTYAKIDFHKAGSETA